MAKKTQTALDKELREKWFNIIKDYVSTLADDVMDTKSAAFTFPDVDAERNDRFVLVTIQIPKGDREKVNGVTVTTPYDGYAVAEEYSLKLKEQAEKKAKADENKRKKIAQDEAFRKAQAEIKAKKAERAKAE